jgi:hypothetical protein
VGTVVVIVAIIGGLIICYKMRLKATAHPPSESQGEERVQAIDKLKCAEVTETPSGRLQHPDAEVLRPGSIASLD